MDGSFTFAVSDAQYVFTFVVMLVVGLVVGQLTARLRHQARFASLGEERARRLFEMARDLSAAPLPVSPRTSRASLTLSAAESVGNR